MADTQQKAFYGRIRRILAPLMLIALLALILVVRDSVRRQPGPETLQVDIMSIPDTVPVSTEIITSIDEAVTVEDSVRFYISRLSDPAYTDTYGDGFTWYIAAEELGMIGRPAISALIERLDSDDDYERTQAFYALRLAAQHENMRQLTGGEYVELTPDAFPSPEIHPELVRAWREWYQAYFR